MDKGKYSPAMVAKVSIGMVALLLLLFLVAYVAYTLFYEPSFKGSQAPREELVPPKANCTIYVRKVNSEAKEVENFFIFLRSAGKQYIIMAKKAYWLDDRWQLHDVFVSLGDKEIFYVEDRAVEVVIPQNFKTILEKESTFINSMLKPDKLQGLIQKIRSFKQD
jgi:hypothetical protein